MESGFLLAFDVRTSPDGWYAEVWPFLLLPLLGLATALLANRLPPIFSPRSPAARRLVGGVLFALLLPLEGLVAYLHFNKMQAYRAIMDEGKAERVEGCLDYFHPMPASGHEYEIIALAGKSFTYSDFDLTMPFTNTEAHGGPIHADSAVRIWHHRGAILRLEVSQRACPPAPDPGKYGPPRDYGSADHAGAGTQQ